MKERIDDYKTRREHLKDMRGTELREYFLKLSEEMMEPLLEMAYTHTSKSIERSVLLRMGFSSIEAKIIVNYLDDHDLLRKGAGHCVYVISKEKNISILEAGKLIQNGEEIDYLLEYFKIYE
jgi:D-ornithine 4,5-aminomutase subunit alpha